MMVDYDIVFYRKYTMDVHAHTHTMVCHKTKGFELKKYCINNQTRTSMGYFLKYQTTSGPVNAHQISWPSNVQKHTKPGIYKVKK